MQESIKWHLVLKYGLLIYLVGVANTFCSSILCFLLDGMMNSIDEIQFELPQRDGAGPKILLTFGGLILLVVFWLGLPAKLLDVLWICCFCLSGAAAIICFAAQRSSDLIGFVSMLAGLSFLRLLTLAGAAGQVIQDESAGILLDTTGLVLGDAWPLGAVLVCLILAGVSVFVVWFSSRRINAASASYLKQVFGLKRMGIETDLRLGVIDDKQADTLSKRMELEGRFFAAMRGAGVLMVAETLICCFVLLLCLFVPASNETLKQTSDEGILAIIAPGVAGLSLFGLIPVMFVAGACGVLMSRDTLALKNTQQGESSGQETKKITVVSLDSQPQDNAELLNPDFLRHRSNEQIAEFEPPQKKTLQSGPVSMDITCRNAKEYYEKLSQVINTVSERPRVILLVSDKVHSLPVTVAVNIAIRLAQKRQRVLLVDTDAQRNAVGKVFDLDLESMQKKVQPSRLEGLAVCCVAADKIGGFLGMKKILDHFDATLIYTPNLSPLNASKIGNGAKPGAFYFVDNENENTTRQAATQLSFCSWLCLIPSIQSVLEPKL